MRSALVLLAVLAPLFAVAQTGCPALPDYTLQISPLQGFQNIQRILFNGNSNAPMDWVDLHFRINGGELRSFRMRRIDGVQWVHDEAYFSARRIELLPGQNISYWATYCYQGVDCDTEVFVYPQPQPPPQAITAPTPILRLQCPVLKEGDYSLEVMPLEGFPGESKIVFESFRNFTFGFVDIHFSINRGEQKNFRMRQVSSTVFAHDEPHFQDRIIRLGPKDFIEFFVTYCIDTLADCDTPMKRIPRDLCPDDMMKIEPGVCGCGKDDADMDNDGLLDCQDACPRDRLKTAPGICGCDIADMDSDQDGSLDCVDLCPQDRLKTAPGLCGCGMPDTDSDGDSIPNCRDQCPQDMAKTSPGLCGCGVADTDSDGDSIPNCRDQCPQDMAKNAPGLCGCGVPDTDSDGDSIPDCRDLCPQDRLKNAPGQCGCGQPETDANANGIADCVEPPAPIELPPKKSCPVITDWTADVIETEKKNFKIVFSSNSDLPIEWVDVHYRVGQGELHNFRMQKQGNVFYHIMPAMQESLLLEAGNKNLYFFFTYCTEGTDCDTESRTWHRGTQVTELPAAVAATILPTMRTASYKITVVEAKVKTLSAGAVSAIPLASSSYQSQGNSFSSRAEPQIITAASTSTASSSFGN